MIKKKGYNLFSKIKTQEYVYIMFVLRLQWVKTSKSLECSVVIVAFWERNFKIIEQRNSIIGKRQESYIAANTLMLTWLHGLRMLKNKYAYQKGLRLNKKHYRKEKLKV